MEAWGFELESRCIIKFELETLFNWSCHTKESSKKLSFDHIQKVEIRIIILDLHQIILEIFSLHEVIYNPRWIETT